MDQEKRNNLAHAIKNLRTAQFHISEMLKLLEGAAFSVGLKVAEEVESVALDRLGDARACLERAHEDLT